MEKKKMAQGLTIEKMKTYKGFENLGDEEAEELITTFRRFSMLTFKYFNYVKEALNGKKRK